jgi:ribosome maturation factor RimP
LDFTEKIRSLVEKTLDGTDKFLVDFSVKPGNKISVFIDGDNGVTVQDCQILNRTIETNFDRDKEDFDLTVSSAGLDHPLILTRQFKKNIGQDLNVTTLDNTRIEGTLVGVSEDGIELEHPVKKPKKEVKKPNTRVNFSEIKTAKIIIKFGK